MGVTPGKPPCVPIRPLSKGEFGDRIGQGGLHAQPGQRCRVGRPGAGLFDGPAAFLLGIDGHVLPHDGMKDHRGQTIGRFVEGLGEPGRGIGFLDLNVVAAGEFDTGLEADQTVGLAGPDIGLSPAYIVMGRQIDGVDVASPAAVHADGGIQSGRVPLPFDEQLNRTFRVTPMETGQIIVELIPQEVEPATRSDLQEAQRALCMLCNLQKTAEQAGGTPDLIGLYGPFDECRDPGTMGSDGFGNGGTQMIGIVTTMGVVIGRDERRCLALTHEILQGAGQAQTQGGGSGILGPVGEQIGKNAVLAEVIGHGFQETAIEPRPQMDTPSGLPVEVS